MKFLVFDISNMLYRSFFANQGTVGNDVDTATGLANHMAMVVLNKFFNQYKPHQIYVACDRPSWRKVYTKSDECLSGKPYKGNRRQKQTPKQKAAYEEFMEHVQEFENLLAEHTTIRVLKADLLEADDLIAGMCQMHPDDEITIISTDKDFMQLIRPGVTLIDPSSGKPRALTEWNDDPEYFMFEKCLRGDTGDNVQAAFPRVRKTRIRTAYADAYERANLMHETWVDHTGKEHVVKDLFEENELLMDLSAQPEFVRDRIEATIRGAQEDPGDFNYFQFMKYLGKYDMKKVASQLEHFVPMLSR